MRFEIFSQIILQIYLPQKWKLKDQLNDRLGLVFAGYKLTLTSFLQASIPSTFLDEVANPAGLKFAK